VDGKTGDGERDTISVGKKKKEKTGADLGLCFLGHLEGGRRGG
jgi:hypothetical protein